MSSALVRFAALLTNAVSLVHRAFGRLAFNRTWSIAGVGLCALVLRAALLPVLGVPEPESHDEFSYLLAADTFAHGRLTNPTHPMWRHLETFHVIQQPTYSSIYPPAQGLVLAVGQLLGHPWVGEWLVTGLMCAAICWMLRGWLPPKWALYGAVIAMLRLGVMSYWMNSYWSSAVVALGGALLLGALPRIQKQRRLTDAVWMAVGIAILVNSRPYEGLVLSMIVVAALVLWMVGAEGPGPKVALRRIAIPVTAVLVVAGLATSYFYYRVTGNPFRLTYQVESQTYNPVPAFLWQQANAEPGYRHATLRRFYELDLQQHADHRTLAGFVNYCQYRILGVWLVFFQALASLPLLALPWLLRDRRMRFPLIAGGLFFLALMAETWGLPHYAAPVTGLLFLIVAQCARRLALWKWRGRPIGRVAVQLIPVLLAANLAMRVGAAATHSPSEPRWPRGNLKRAAIVAELDKRPGKHVVIVRYAPSHDPDFEWVYNAADIDAAKVVWARDMGAEENLELLTYFRDRRIWTIALDDVARPTLTPY